MQGLFFSNKLVICMAGLPARGKVKAKLHSTPPLSSTPYSFLWKILPQNLLITRPKKPPPPPPPPLLSKFSIKKFLDLHF